MYHELFLLLSHADENNGLLKLHSIPDYIEELLDTASNSSPLKKAVKKLTRHQLLKKADLNTYHITEDGRKELQHYKTYLEQQHQKGPSYYIEPIDEEHLLKNKVNVLQFLTIIGTLLGLCRKASQNTFH